MLYFSVFHKIQWFLNPVSQSLVWFVVMLQTVFCSVGSVQGFYLLVLIGCDCGELSFWEGEAVHSFSRQRLDLRQIQTRVVPDDVHTRFVFMHRLKDDLNK